ncbi:MAG TPA: hypothetical protein VKP60_16905 [Magnetospirillaceae bacterium]|nr:hypothetical protein [Magnetospirillaceae bacterium]
MISEIEAEMVRAKAIVTGTAIVLALALTNPSPDDYRLRNKAPEISRVNLVVASLYDGHVLGAANFFFSF